ncbi:MAG: DsbA family protein [Pyrinomonadaceae bacterium]|nr:DsbA family protein [Acidobacteriota bacterium]MBK7935241.1 DsbA family protein [Acidobacteriota bacterium]MBP7376460.1 DsbA family protein [Pyrinomonadaceae bacterium]
MRKEIIILGAIIALVVVGAVIGSNYYRSSVQKESVVGNSNSGGKPKIAPEQLVRPDSPSLGPADAKVTLVEFYDPECESCASFAPVVKKILKEYEGKIRFVTRYMPLHPNSLTAANFTEAAGEQGKYWEAQDILFRKQPEWGTKHGPPTAAPLPNINELFDKYAKELGLDMEKASAAIKSKKFDAKIEQDRKDGQAIGVRRTPTFFVNGRELATFGESYLRALIEEEMKK